MDKACTACSPLFLMLAFAWTLHVKFPRLSLSIHLCKVWVRLYLLTRNLKHFLSLFVPLAFCQEHCLLNLKKKKCENYTMHVANCNLKTHRSNPKMDYLMVLNTEAPRCVEHLRSAILSTSAQPNLLLLLTWNSAYKAFEWLQ